MIEKTWIRIDADNCVDGCLDNFPVAFEQGEEFLIVEAITMMGSEWIYTHHRSVPANGMVVLHFQRDVEPSPIEKMADEIMEAVSDSRHDYTEANLRHGLVQIINKHKIAGDTSTVRNMIIAIAKYQHSE